MKKLLSLVLIFCLLPVCSFADSEYFKFAGIALDGLKLGTLKTELESATGLSFHYEGIQLTTDVEPPITFMGLPVYTIYASAQALGSAQISVCLTPFEIDGYTNGSIQSFDSGVYDQIREKAGNRFGSSSRMCINFFSGSFDDFGNIDSAKSYRFPEAEIPYLLNDVCSFMFRNAYGSAYIEIYRKNTSESYIITNATGQSMYGNVNVAFVVPTFTYFANDIEELIDESAYSQFQQFPMFNGAMQYLKDF